MPTSAPNCRIFPVSLLLEGRRCLVIGGGKIAAHKTSLLLAAGAAVTVVAPTLVHDSLATLLAANAICWQEHEFSAADLANAFLVFAATDNRAVNRHVLQCCREHQVLCCCVDGNWTSSDFVTPATLRTAELTVAVSTGGRSCRRSRLVKDSLSRHIKMVESADLIVLGTSHNYLSLNEREPFHLTGTRLAQTGAMLMQVWGVHEFMLVNTCNRVELMAVVARETELQPLLERVLGFDHLPAESYYCKRGFEAFSHSAVLGAGLLSQTPGEKHIVAQLKEALQNATTANWAGGMLQEWLDSVLHVSKDIRHQTTPLLHNDEVEDLCLSFVADDQRELAGQRLLIVGAGMVASALVERFCPQGCRIDWCYHVNRPELPAAWGAQVRLGSLNELRNWLPEADIVVCATSSSGHVLHHGHAPFFDQEKPVRIIDLSMPRNVAPTLHGLMPNVTVTDLDDLKHWYRRAAVDMAQVFEISKQVVVEHTELYDKILYHFQGGNAQQ